MINASTPATLRELPPLVWHDGEVTQPRMMAIKNDYSGMLVASARTKTSALVSVRRDDEAGALQQPSQLQPPFYL